MPANTGGPTDGGKLSGPNDVSRTQAARQIALEKLEQQRRELAEIEPPADIAQVRNKFLYEQETLNNVDIEKLELQSPTGSTQKQAMTDLASFEGRPAYGAAPITNDIEILKQPLPGEPRALYGAAPITNDIEVLKQPLPGEPRPLYGAAPITNASLHADTTAWQFFRNLLPRDEEKEESEK